MSLMMNTMNAIVDNVYLVRVEWKSSDEHDAEGSHDDKWKLDSSDLPDTVLDQPSPGRAVPCSAVCRIKATRTL